MEYKFPLVKYINGKQYSSYIYGSKRIIDLDGYFPERSIDSLGLSSSNKNHEFYLFKEDDGHWSCTVRLTLFDIRTILIMLEMFNIITNNGSKIIYTEDKTPEEIITEINNIGLVKINNKIRIEYNKENKMFRIVIMNNDTNFKYKLLFSFTQDVFNLIRLFDLDRYVSVNTDNEKNSEKTYNMVLTDIDSVFGEPEIVQKDAELNFEEYLVNNQSDIMRNLIKTMPNNYEE
jgi:hypothetical protein